MKPKIVIKSLSGTNRYHGPFRAVPKDDILQLDALRGISAYGVAIGHANQFIIAPTTSSGNVVFGLLAQGSVMIFFVLSGFLIGKSICRNIEGKGGDAFSLARYAKDRLWRIYPPLLFAVVLMLAIWAVAPAVLPSGTTQFLHPNPNYGRDGINLEWRSVLYTLIFRNGFSSDSPDMNGPLWSLSVEVWYYIIFGSVVALMRRPFLLLIFVLMIWRFIGRNDDFTAFAVVWISGYVLSIAHNRGYFKRGPLAIGFVASNIAAVIFATLFANPEIAPGHSWIRYYNVAIGLGFAFALGAIIGGYARLPQLLPHVFARASKFSYTLYLVHVPIYLLLFGILEQRIVGSLALSLLAAALCIAIVTLIAWAAARLVENKQRLQSSLRLTK